MAGWGAAGCALARGLKSGGTLGIGRDVVLSRVISGGGILLWRGTGFDS
jgi:hypothetical protein